MDIEKARVLPSTTINHRQHNKRHRLTLPGMLCNHGYQLDYIILNFREALFEGCSLFCGRMLLQSMVAEKDTPVTVQKVDPAWFRARPGPVPGRLRFPLQIPSNYVVGVVTSVNVINVTWLLKKIYCSR